MVKQRATELLPAGSSEETFQTRSERLKPFQFKKGNRAAVGHGRPKAATSLIDGLRNLDTPENAQRVTEAIWRKAMRGESWAVEFLFNRLYGRVPQVTRVGGLHDADGAERPIPLLLLPSAPLIEVDGGQNRGRSRTP